MVRSLSASLALTALCAAPAAAQEARFERFAYSGADPVHEAVQPGEGQYRNPVLSGFYPDPSNTRAGEDYYLTTSTFAYFPGLPVFHSRDLVNWELIGHAIDRPGMVDFGELGLSRGLFAPAIEHHDGLFYILNTCVDCGDNFVITAEDPAGPWSDPVWLPDLDGGIDPSLFVDDDGRAYLLNNGPPDREPEYEGHRAVWIQEFDLETLQTFGPRTVLIDGGVDFSTQPIWIEGPHIYKVDGTYFLTAAEGGTAVNHSQVMLKSDSPTGPYEPYENNPILTQRDLPQDRDFPITSAGHADLVQTPDGEWWATFLAVRPYQGDSYNTGRETFLMPVSWETGWPVITEPGEEIPYAADRPALPEAPVDTPMTGPFDWVEEFDGETLDGAWLAFRDSPEGWARLEDGALILEPRSQALADNARPSYLGRRQQHIHGEAELTVAFEPTAEGDRAGLAAVQSDEFWYFIGLVRENGETVLRVERRDGPDSPRHGDTLAETPLDAEPGAPVDLKIVARGGEYDFAYRAEGGDWTRLLDGADGEILSTRVAGGFVGVTMGPYAYRAE